MLNPNAKDKLLANWIAIVLATISIIQGLAFNFLVVNMPAIIDHTLSSKNFILAAHFLLSFALLLRVFQTYITAALDYDDWQVGLFDILTIFFIGAFEYYLFSILSVAKFDIRHFHFRLSIISFLALAGYINAFFSIKPQAYLIYHDYLRERKLQLVNIIGITIVLLNSFFFLLAQYINYSFTMAITLISSAIIFYNIYYSVELTFLSRARIPKDSIIPNQSPSTNNYTSISISHCTKNKIPDLLNLFFEYFSYVYISIFDTSPRLTKIILKKLFLINSGNHPLGYKYFLIATVPDSQELLGLILINKRGETKVISVILVFFLISIKIFITNGIIGLYRAIRNARMVSNEIWKCSPDEIQITYLAVKNDLHSKGIGTQLLDYAKNIALQQNKKRISLEVRDSNSNARNYFINYGFKEVAIVHNEFDELLDRGSRIIMHYEL